LRRFEHPKTPALVFRRTYGELLANHIDPLFTKYPALRSYYNVGDKILRLPARLGGGSIAFGFAENPGDIFKFQGQGYMDILIDEATHLAQPEIDFLRTCNRHTGVDDTACKMIMTCNPGGVGHNYIKRVFVDKNYIDNEIPSSYAFIPAYGWDNIEWSRSALKHDGFTESDYYKVWDDQQRFQYFITRTQYGRDLNALPESLRIQHLLGRWDYFEGQVFPELSTAHHDLDRYLDTSNDDSVEAFVDPQRKISSHDHASTGITAHVMCAINSSEDAFAFDEYYRKDRLISEHAADIKAMHGKYGALDYTLVDPSTEAKTLQNKDEMMSVQDAYYRCGLSMMSANRSSIQVGIDLIKEYLKINPLHRNPFTQELGSPRIFISRRRCSNLWREMSELQITNDNGKVKYIGSDHALDNLRYMLMSRPNAAEVKKIDVRTLPAMTRLMVSDMEKKFANWGEDLASGSWF
jgi:phage terminase large subunit